MALPYTRPISKGDSHRLVDDNFVIFAISKETLDTTLIFSVKIVIRLSAIVARKFGGRCEALYTKASR